jgi:hypothetical protein
MPRRLILFALSLPLLAVDVSGNWTFRVDLGARNGAPKFILQQRGESLTGSYFGRLGEAKLKGTVKGDRIEFQFEVSGTSAVYTGKVVSKTEMKGLAEYAGISNGSWTAKKD